MAAALLLAWPRPSIAQEVPTAARDAVTEAADLKRDGRLADAERRLGEAIQQAPAYDEAWWLNAWVQLGLQDDAAALLAFRKAARLLPADDPRVAQAVAQADALAAVGVALPQPAPAAPAVPAVLPQAPARPAPLPVGHPWAGWPAALLFLAAALSCGTAWLALRADARHGPAGPHAQFALLARRLARGERNDPATRALQLVLDPALALSGGRPGGRAGGRRSRPSTLRPNWPTWSTARAGRLNASPRWPCHGSRSNPHPSSGPPCSTRPTRPSAAPRCVGWGKRPTRRRWFRWRCSRGRPSPARPCSP